MKNGAVTLPPELILPAIPTPPSTTNEPVVVLVLGVGVDEAEGVVIDPELVQVYVLYPPATVIVGLPVVVAAEKVSA
jgi:hypothetical protein